MFPASCLKIGAFACAHAQTERLQQFSGACTRQKSLLVLQLQGWKYCRYMIMLQSVADFWALMRQHLGGDEQRCRGAAAWLTSRDPVRLAAEARAGQGVVDVHLDGRALRLCAGEHFTLPLLPAALLESSGHLANGA